LKGGYNRVAALFPLFLKLKRRKCLMVGAGEIGESKIAGLLEAHADVHVVAPSATKRVKDWSREGRVRWSRREFRESDLEGCLLVVAATSSSELHKKISQLALRRGVLCNVVDVPDLCDFYYPAVVRRGALQIAVSTGGESPALAQRLRKKLEKEFGPEYEAWLQELGRSRRKLSASSRDMSVRKAKLHSMASEESFRAFLRKRSAIVDKKKR
jgi:precorrin-2 dehydrogenase / sirohydrochlorin ferrochelatase